MYILGIIIMVVGFALTVVGRTVGDNASKSLLQEKKSILLDLNRPYWIYPQILLELVFLILFFINRDLIFSFYPIASVQMILAITVTIIRRKKLIELEFPTTFIQIRTVAVFLQQFSPIVSIVGLFLIFNAYK